MQPSETKCLKCGAHLRARDGICASCEQAALHAPRRSTCVVCRVVPRMPGGANTCSWQCAKEWRAIVSRENGKRAAAVHKKPHPPKPCAICGKQFGENLAPSKLAKRKTCSMECSREYMQPRKKDRSPCIVCGEPCSTKAATCSRDCLKKSRTEDSPPRTCEVCSRLYYRKVGNEHPSHFTRRRACGIKCAGVLANRKRYADKIYPPKPCARCGNMFGPEDGEEKYNFTRRITCGAYQCVTAGRRGKTWDVFGVAMTVKEIAKMLGRNESGVSVRLQNGGVENLFRPRRKPGRRGPHGR